MIILLVMVFVGIALYEVPALIRNKYWRELAAFSFFLLVAFAMSLLQTAGVDIPSPMRSLQYLIKDVLHLNYKS